MKEVYSTVLAIAVWSKKGITLQYEKGDRKFHFCFGDWTNNQHLPLGPLARKVLLTCTCT